MKHSVVTPISREMVESFRAGDRVYISGKIYTARDQAHLRLITDEAPNFDLQDAVIYYVGPTPPRPGNPIGSSGPTSSYRMDNLAIPLMKRGLRVMIGKGDRSKLFIEEMINNRAVYLIATGGTGALLASCIKSSRVIMYEDLGTEAVHELIVENFPCFVAYDIFGGSIFFDKDKS